MRYFVFALLSLLAIVGCAVKDKPGETVQPVTSGNLPEGLYVSEGKQFLVRPSSVDLVPHEENTVLYTFATTKLEAVDASAYTFEVWSDMPTMPQMGGPWKAPVEIKNGKLAATYNIYHGHKKHLWEFKIHILKDGKVVDKLVYSHLVREE